MASVKNLKSKGRAAIESFDYEADGYVYNNEYELRKQQFADSPAAKIVKPVRYLKGKATDALKGWQRHILAEDNLGVSPENSTAVFPQYEIMRSKYAQLLNGRAEVHELAASA